ncbi:polysaccharide deacetylase family protein [Klugiella xanthotipulae]|uniref:Peptidoglycan/xylan/chitin deacetylase (PgdA/CDA1 family) n=1 Tax=Klugiella xanthotipulae TaxID=244735 RepID=A0A543I569_9MICO|nr:polysaccharide deacetylase family protein [Klugiella xanthotipulae]TQM65753.1 peptidoglycan/xylan/chitin deacetylase (PgdA/CDA1 family) [Klugiella xanthotipulae]
MSDQGAGLRRRDLLGGVGGGLALLGLSACAARPDPTAQVSVSPSAVLTSPGPVSASPTPAIPVPNIDPNAVSARFEGRVPTEWGLTVTGVVTSLAVPTDATGRERVALTLDACGGPHGSEVDSELLALLDRLAVPVTLFLNARWIEQNRGVAENLAANPLVQLGNHGTRHRPLSVSGREAYGIAGTASVAEAVDEVWGNHQVLTELCGRPPLWFRSGTAHYDEVAVALVEAVGETVIGFSTNADGGATFPAETVRAEALTVSAGGILIGHMNRPDSGTAAGLAVALPELLTQGVVFAHLDAPGG